MEKLGNQKLTGHPVRVTSVRENQGISKSRFKSGKVRENRPFWGKSGNFIINQGKIPGNFVIVFIIYNITLA